MLWCQVEGRHATVAPAGMCLHDHCIARSRVSALPPLPCEALYMAHQSTTPAMYGRGEGQGLFKLITAC